MIIQEAPLSQEHAIDLGLQVLLAAGFAHRRGVIHRDFKPHNVIVDDAGHAKVTDFGIARAGASEMTETGSIMGTAQYLSPEQAQGHAVTDASDLYSIGVMLYEMLAGRLPFDGDSAVSIALKHLNEAPVPLSTLRPDIDPALESVVMAALSKDPAARWQSAEDFAEALEAARAHVLAGGSQRPEHRRLGRGGARCRPTTAATPASPSPSRNASGAAGRGSRWRLLVLAMIGVMAFALHPRRRPTCPRSRASSSSRPARRWSAPASRRSRSNASAAWPNATACSTRSPAPARSGRGQHGHAGRVQRPGRHARALRREPARRSARSRS